MMARIKSHSARTDVTSCGLHRKSVITASGTFTWRRDGTYLITGGLGDIGLHIARTLVANGVRRLVLVNRTQLPPREEWGKTTPDTALGQRIAAVRALEAEGVAVHLAALDVSDESQLRSFIDRYAAEAWPPIRGVIHAAGILDSHVAAMLSPAAFDAVVGPKLRGAQNLDRLLPDLDQFVLISSTAAFLVQTGQTNYATANAGLDALAHDRRARGLPALSIAWGVWDNTGMVKGEAGERNVAELARQGVHTFSPERGTKLFAWLCDCTKPHVAVLPIDWEKFRRARAGRDYPIFRRMLAGSPGVIAAEPELNERLAQVGLAERRQMLDRVVRDAVGAVLKIAPSRLDPRKVLGTMGLTSLMAIELRNRLEGGPETTAVGNTCMELSDGRSPRSTSGERRPYSDIGCRFSQGSTGSYRTNRLHRRIGGDFGRAGCRGATRDFRRALT